MLFFFAGATNPFYSLCLPSLSHTHTHTHPHTPTHTHTHTPAPTLLSLHTCASNDMLCFSIRRCVRTSKGHYTPLGTIVRECLQHSLSSFVTPCFWSKQRGGSKVQTDETALLTDQHTPPGLGLECKSNSRCRKASNKRRYILTPRPLWDESLG